MLGFDMILNWNLYQNNNLISSDGAQCISCPDADTIQFDMLRPYKTDLSGLSLVPEYSYSGEHMEEAITLQTINDN